MTIGLTIPGVQTVHPREVWVDPCFPVIGPRQDMRNVIQPVCHYSAAAMTPDGDVGESADNVASWLRAVNRDYWLNRKGSGITSCGRFLPGYAVGYLFAIDAWGGAWELRGFDIRAASNAPTNEWTFPILFITDGATPASTLAWQTARAVWREAKRRSGRPDFVNVALEHSRLPLAATECSGAGIRAQLALGYGDITIDEGVDMGVNAIPPVRAYDSRSLAGVDAPYNTINTTLGVIQPGQPREVFIAYPEKQAQLNITAIGQGGAGYLTISPTPDLPNTSVVNYDGNDAVESNTVLTLLTAGKCWVHAVVSPAHVAIDVQGKG